MDERHDRVANLQPPGPRIKGCQVISQPVSAIPMFLPSDAVNVPPNACAALQIIPGDIALQPALWKRPGLEAPCA